MCVICAAAKKRHMKREEVLQAIKANSAGFFGFTVHDGVRRTLRTLDEKAFMKFFDDVVEDDDIWVMHARIPSRGDRSVDNVHGWEEDGIIFCHNMTLTSLDGMMRDAKWEGTDSEFFFRHVFMPFYRGCGKDAYADGKFCPDLDNIVRHFCGTSNKFLFIMPDDRLVVYGDWVTEKDRTEDGKPAFMASNSSYKVYERTWNQFGGTGRRGWYPHDAWSGYGYGDDEWGTDADGEGADLPAPAKTPAQDGKDKRDDLVKLVVDTLGAGTLCRLALYDIVTHGAIQFRALSTEATATPDEGDDVQLYLETTVPDVFSEDTYSQAVVCLENVADPVSETMKETPETFAKAYASEIAEPLLKAGSKSLNGLSTVPYFPKAEHVKAGVARTERQWRVFKRVVGLETDFTAKSPGSFVCMMDTPVKDGTRWRTPRVRTEDIIVDAEMSVETAFKGVAALLEWIQDDGETQKGDAA